MSTAQASALRTHLQTLCDNGAGISAFPDAVDLKTTWGATDNDLARLVAMVREHCPKGYFVPYVCQHTNMKVVMVRGQGHLFSHGLLATMASIRYCRTRLSRLSRDLKRMAEGFPAGSQFQENVRFVTTMMDSTSMTGGYLSQAVRGLPALARRAQTEERRALQAYAAEYAA